MKQKIITRTVAVAFSIITSIGASAQGVAIGDKDFTPNAAAMLDVQSKTKGVLFPRVTYTERMYIQANAQSVGLLVYQTDREAGYYYWDGLAWKYLAPPQTVELPTLATVATTGSYGDLTNKPVLATVATTGSYSDLTSKPAFATVATTGSYSDLTSKPTFATVAMTGDYNDLANKPTLSGGSTTLDYNALTNKPTIPTRLQDLEQDENYYTTVTRAERELWNSKASISDIPTRLQDLQQDENYYSTITRAEREKWNAAAQASVFTGNYNDLVNRPALKPVATSGSYNDLTDKPTFSVSLGEDGESVSLSTVALTGSYNDLKDKPTIPGGNDVTWATVANTGSYNDLSDKPAIPTRLQDLQQDEIYYTTVTRAERELWSSKASISDIPTRLQDLQQDENYYTTVSKAERERWDAAAAAGGFSGDYNDLVNKPRLGDLQQDENYYTTVSKAERDAWNAKSTFSGSYGDLQDKPTIPAHLRDLTTDEYYMTVSTAEKETWNTKVSQADLNEFVTPTERANWNNAAANSTVAVSKTKLSDFDSNDDSKHYTVEEKTKLAGIAVNAEVNVNADWSATSGDAQIQNKPTLGTLAAKNSIGNADVASDAAIALSKINIPDNGILASKISGLADVATSGSYNDLENKPTIPANIVTYTQDVNGTITLNKSPSLSTGNNVANANEPFGDLVEAFVANNATIRAAIMEAVVEAVETTNSDLYKAIRRAAVPVGTIVMWNGELSTIPCGWDEVKNMRSRFPVGAGDGDGEGAALSGYGVKGKGGEEKHQLSISEMPSHSHEINQYAAHVPGGEKWLIDIVYKEGVYGTGSVASTGGNQAHENRPPYYAIYFIKKTSDNCPENHTEITD